MYQDKDWRRITLYMTREDGKPAQTIKVTMEGALRVAYWLDGVMEYAVSAIWTRYSSCNWPKRHPGRFVRGS